MVIVVITQDRVSRINIITECRLQTPSRATGKTVHEFKTDGLDECGLILPRNLSINELYEKGKNR